ncbi:putative serine/threonine-protein kinase drkC [Wallemia ichthyophaga EXF-994]|uniref:Putative serine/threonine-protein kinase drkC n=1 Tax=Wallemia ichthyophaga (strain EXF-994 / CBS 113033) TaxID=1299270 RepID=R9ALJ6_WALI9|nr:putative serine/threonine-protein kinase drkC [Wallemia ichthyophaga EXF-994]EOR00936.1 putative serine/threonine-protein kinase drkC [Wallemia ichthyophaga EXF-994]TIB37467.1 hypothetical protein E3P84_00249 [Wallemia ichthyophaga]TIB44298.1 hypothetical protein E3P83_00249 [Wallemia ichthyophaga]
MSTMSTKSHEDQLRRCRKADLLEMLTASATEGSDCGDLRACTKEMLIEILLEKDGLRDRRCVHPVSLSSEDEYEDGYSTKPLSVSNVNSQSSGATAKRTRAAKRKAMNKISVESLNNSSQPQNRYQLRTRTISIDSSHTPDEDFAKSVSLMSIADSEKDSAATASSSNHSSDAENRDMRGVRQSDDVSDTDIDVDMRDETVSSLKRYLKRQLEQMCNVSGIEHSKHHTKDDLIELLLLHKEDMHSVPVSSASEISSTTAVSDFEENASIDSDLHTPKPQKKRSRQGRGTKPTRAVLSDLSSTVTARQSDTTDVSKATPKPGHRSSNTSEGLALDLQELGLVNKEIKATIVEKKERIGSGGFKDVYVGSIRKKKCAVADIRGELTEMDIRELQVLSKLNHPNIVKFIGVSVPGNGAPVMLISELCKNGDLFDYLRNNPPPTNKKALLIMLDIARGLEYLHITCKPQVIHRDMKSSNVLIDDNGRAKLNDFGLARVKQSTRSMIQSLVGTVNWQAPELWSAKPSYTASVDIFATALVYWEILQWHSTKKCYPWEGQNEHFIYDQVGQKHKRPSLNQFKRQWGGDVLDLIERMWVQDGKHRPSATEVVQELDAIIKNTA